MLRDLRFLVTLLVVATVFSGCIFSPKPEPVKDPGKTQLTPPDTPENLMKRFVQVYEAKNLTEYNKLFTGDFLFEFSNSADPDLATQYSAGWFREDERAAAQNLFNGGVNNEGFLQPAAQSIDLNLTQGVPQDDNSEGRDPELNKVLFTPVSLTIQLPPDANDPEGKTFVVGGADPAVHRFFLVRGDAANGLDEDQPADDTHWYIFLWRDESTVNTPSSPSSPLAADQAGSSTTPPAPSWGTVKGTWR